MSFAVNQISNNAPSSSHHSSTLASLLDQLSFFMVYPWATAFSKVVAYYFIEDAQPPNWYCEFKEKFVLGPVLCIIFLALFPVGITGFFIWVCVCTFSSRKRYSYLELCPNRTELSKEVNKTVFTIASTNVMLANEAFCRLSNNRNPMLRSKLIGRALLHQTQFAIHNFSPNMSKKDSVLNYLPDVDILCIQEVWERYWAAMMIDQLGRKYSYFIHDVGDYRLKSNYCLFGSGLFVACKYPIIAIEFQPFQYRTYYARAFSYGVVCLKIRIDNEKVAYVANLHAQACQGKDTVLHYQFTETLSAVNAFRLKTQLPEDVVVFDTICGDFNFDNMSPEDVANQKHPLFNQYVDVCSKGPGEDHTWAVGTELQHGRMRETIAYTPEGLRNVLINKSKGRYYVDAGGVGKINELASPATNQDGNLRVESWGGMRRIDRILLRKDVSAKTIGYAFSTVLAGLTDHIPVALSLELSNA